MSRKPARKGKGKAYPSSLPKGRKAPIESVLRRFRPRKEDKGKVIYLSAFPVTHKKGKRKTVERAGKRLPESTKRKVYVVKVLRSGRVVPQAEFVKRGQKKVIKPVRIRQADLTTFRDKRITRSLFTKSHKVSAEPLTVERKQGQRTLDFVDDILPKAVSELAELTDKEQGPVSFVIRFAVTVRTGKTTRTVESHAIFKRSDAQRFSDAGFFEPFVKEKLYAEMAQALSVSGEDGEPGIVTSGSANFIRRLSANRGVSDKRLWKDSKGFNWKHGQGDKLQVGQIIRFDMLPALIRR